MRSHARPERSPREPWLPVPPGPWNADVWLIPRDLPRFEVSGTSTCAVEGCERPAGAVAHRVALPQHALCVGHQRRFQKDTNQKDLVAFTSDQATASPIRQPRGKSERKSGYPPIRFDEAPALLANELRLIVARKSAQDRWSNARYIHEVLSTAIELANMRGYESILDFPVPPGARQMSKEEWVQKALPDLERISPQARSFAMALPSMRRMVLGARADPWDEETWDARLLGLQQPGLVGYQRWSSVTVDWLADGIRSYAKNHLLAGTRAWGTIKTYVRAGSIFSSYVEDVRGYLEPGELTREVFLDFVAWVRSDTSSKSDRNAVTALARILQDMREDGIVPGLPVTQFLLRGENPVPKTRRPRPFPEDLKAQIAALIASDDAVLPDDVRLMLRLMQAVGPRPSECLTMPRSAIVQSSRGYRLDYFQTKTESWRSVPLTESLGTALAQQAADVVAEHGEGCDLLFPYLPARQRDALGSQGFRPWLYGGFNRVVWSAYQQSGIRGSAMTGETLRGPSLHRFRHSIATDLLNDGWSQYEVQKFLGHKSPTMMQSYAEINDTKQQDKYLDFVQRSVDVLGLPHDLTVETVSDAERLRDRLVRTTLPNGFCTLPEKSTCSFAPSPCLTCKPWFRTTATFLPIHIRQRDETLRELDLAKADGRDRAVQAHETTLVSLNAIIGALEEEAEHE